MRLQLSRQWKQRPTSASGEGLRGRFGGGLDAGAQGRRLRLRQGCWNPSASTTAPPWTRCTSDLGPMRAEMGTEQGQGPEVPAQGLRSAAPAQGLRSASPRGASDLAVGTRGGLVVGLSPAAATGGDAVAGGRAVAEGRHGDGREGRGRGGLGKRATGRESTAARLV